MSLIRRQKVRKKVQVPIQIEIRTEPKIISFVLVRNNLLEKLFQIIHDGQQLVDISNLPYFKKNRKFINLDVLSIEEIALHDELIANIVEIYKGTNRLYNNPFWSGLLDEPLEIGLSKKAPAIALKIMYKLPNFSLTDEFVNECSWAMSCNPMSIIKTSNLVREIITDIAEALPCRPQLAIVYSFLLNIFCHLKYRFKVDIEHVLMILAQYQYEDEINSDISHCSISSLKEMYCQDTDEFWDYCGKNNYYTADPWGRYEEEPVSLPEEYREELIDSVETATYNLITEIDDAIEYVDGTIQSSKDFRQ